MQCFIIVALNVILTVSYASAFMPVYPHINVKCISRTQFQYGIECEISDTQMAVP